MLGDERIVGAALQRLEKVVAGVVTAHALVGDDRGMLDAERAEAHSFTALRRAQYAAGRRAARLALARLAFPAVPIKSDARGAPILPDGVACSISHKHYLAIAAAVRSETASATAIGIDLEEDREPHEEDLLARVCTERERETLPLLRVSGIASPATWIHSAKEAVFKAAYVVDGLERDYDEIEVELSNPSTFIVRRLANGDPTRCAGFFVVEGDALVCLAIFGG